MEGDQVDDTISEAIAVLREERRRAIRSYQFRQAKDIEGRIAAIRSADASSRKIKLSRKFDTEKESLRQKAQALHADYQRQLMVVRLSFQSGVGVLKESYASESSKLSNAFVKTMEVGVQRSVPEADGLLRAAKVTADCIGSVEAAEELTAQGLVVAARAVEQRQAAIRQAYEAKQNALKTRHQEEMERHEARMQNELKMLRVKHETELGVLRQMYTVYAAKYRKVVGPEEVASFFAPYRLAEEGESSAPEPTKKILSAKAMTPRRRERRM
jgi:hypothetical protein